MCRYIFLLFCIIGGMHSVSIAQIAGEDAEEETAGRYSHWTAGVSVGEPFIFCNLTSFSARKTYWGVSVGAFGGYQFNPVLGLALTVDYGMNKAGAHSYALDRKLGPDGTTYYLPDLPGTSFADIYSEISFVNVGLQASFNLNRVLFQPVRPHRFTVLLQPAFYVQRFRAHVYDRQKRKVTDGSLNKGADFGLGADLALRARINSRFDMQLSSGLVWAHNNTFDGVNNQSNAKDDYLWCTKVSLICKINRKSKGEKENILYAPASPAAVAGNGLEELLDLLEKKTQQEKELLAELKAMQQKQDISGGKATHSVDTLYIIQKEVAAPVQPVSTPEAREEWIIRLMGKIKAEHPEIIEEVGYDTLVRQVIQAREEYAEYYTDEKVPAKLLENATPRYAIQIYAMTNPFPPAFFKDTPGIRVVRLMKDKLYRYLYAVYDSKEEARAVLPGVQKKYWDAFIREFDDYMIKNALILDQSVYTPQKKTRRK